MVNDFLNELQKIVTVPHILYMMPGSMTPDKYRLSEVIDLESKIIDVGRPG